MHDVNDLPDGPDSGDGGEVVSVELPAEDTQPVAAAAADPTASPRWFPETVGGALYLLILTVAVVAVAITVLADWRIGMRAFAGALFGAAACRLVLPEARAGMLEVRSRGVDVGTHLVVGSLLLFLAGSIPDQPL